MSIIEPEGWQLIKAVDHRVKDMVLVAGSEPIRSSFRTFVALLHISDSDSDKTAEQKTIWELVEAQIPRSGIEASQFEKAKAILSTDISSTWNELLRCVTLQVPGSCWRELRQFLSNNLSVPQSRLMMQFNLVEMGGL